MKLFRVFSIVLLLALSVPQVTAAALGPTDPLTVTVTPQYPRPYDVVTITPGSSLFDLSGSNVTISVNGKVIEEGSGARSTTAQVGGPGTSTTVHVSAKDGETGQTYVQDVVLRPADVALILDSVSTTHPFYGGASLIAPEGRVRLVAIPDLRTSGGAVIPTQNLVYTWKNGDKVLLDQSGIGRSVLDAVAPVRYRDARITLTVSTQDKSIVASAVALVSPIDPLVRTYRISPLLGPLYETALGTSVLMDGTEDTFRVVPYFFKTMPNIAWTVNGVASETSQDMTVRISDPGTGSARVGVTAQAPQGLQVASGSFVLNFSSGSGGGIFGL